MAVVQMALDDAVDKLCGHQEQNENQGACFQA